MPIDGTLWVQANIAEHLHANYGVDEKEHSNEQAYIWQSLERLYERPQQNANGVALAEQFDEASGAKQTQEAEVNRCRLEN